MRRAGDIANFFDRRAQDLPRLSEPNSARVTIHFVRRGGDFKTRVSELLTHRLVKLLSNLRALPFLSVDHFSAELFYSLAAGRETVEHFVDSTRESRRVVVGQD